MWWRLVRDEGIRVVPRWVTRSRMPDVLPERLWRDGAVWFGGRLHFCVGHLESAHRTIEWKGTDWLVGFKAYTGKHAEREPNEWDDPDSYE